jgi:hypothetical protein
MPRRVVSRGTNVQRILMGFLALILCACSQQSPATKNVATRPVQAEIRGGSNYLWYRIDNCNREPYGVLANYAEQKPVINAQLAQMYAAGQRSLRLMLFHYHAQPGSNLDPTGKGHTQMDSTGGRFPPEFEQNLAGFLRDVKAAGFAEVEVAFAPQASNNPYAWNSWQEDVFQENWGVVQSLHSVIASAGIAYLIDLGNEMIPRYYIPNSQVLLQYCQRMWALYAAQFGISDTVGFSMIPLVDTVNELPNVYGSSPYGYPLVYDFHFYDDSYNQFLAVSNALAGQRSTQPWIVGEGYYNDSVEAVSLQQAINLTGQRVRYVTQWPLTLAKTCGAGAAVDVTPPIAYSNYIGSGF